MSRTASIACICLLLALVVAATMLFPGNPYAQNYEQSLQAPSTAHIFGTDDLGRDLRARVFQGLRLGLLVSFTSCSLALLLGGALGFCILLSPPLVGKGLEVLPTAVMAFPPLLLALSLVAVGKPGLLSLTVTLTVVFAPVFARLVEVEGRALLQKDYIVASRSFGSSSFMLVRRHLLPALRIPLLVQGSSLMAIAIQTEAALSFIGLGVQPPQASWGTLLMNSRRYLAEAPWLVVAPALSLCLVVFLLFALSGLLNRGRN